MTEYTSICRVRLHAAPTLPLESTEQMVWLSRSCRCTRHGLLGVPCKRVDVLVDERVDDIDDEHCIVLEVGSKAGRYDGAERVRLALRRMRRADADRLQLGVFDLDLRGSSIDLDLRGLDGAQLWGATYQRLRTEMADYDPCRLVMWHWTRYYRHIDHADALALAESWTIDVGATLSQANRAASRALYGLGRALGWRKLTLRERTRLGLDGGQWVREDVYAAAQWRLGSPTGCGEATLRAASSAGDFASYTKERP